MPVPRLFVALELPEVLKQAICGLQAGLRDARWLEADALHLTLAFVGEVDPSAQRRIEEALARVEAPPLAVDLHGIGHFPHRGPLPACSGRGLLPRRSSERSPPPSGAPSPKRAFPPDRRKFAPHVTIARFRRPPPPPALHDYLGTYSLFRSPPAPIASFRLLSSVLRPSGARYAPEADFPLASSGR